MDRGRIDRLVEELGPRLTRAADEIWDLAETRFEEGGSAALLADLLEGEGFSVRRGLAGMPTAFVASYGQLRPRIGLLAEYDALAGLGQAPGIAQKRALVPGGPGHGCGHHLLGAGAAGAALALKSLIASGELRGSVALFGCPAEEGGSGKTFMARDGAFGDLDAALTWHPGALNAVFSAPTLANLQARFRFVGKPAHAAMAPQLGRSALDAVELMSVGANYLREHVDQRVRFHYAVTDPGGDAPNVVQARAEVLYLVRAPEPPLLAEVYDRICDVARGAALMTGTSCEISFEKACSSYLPNSALDRLLQANLEAFPAPTFDSAERAFAREIRATLGPGEGDADLEVFRRLAGDRAPELDRLLAGREFGDVVPPLIAGSQVLPGSTDVGDVSWVVPTSQAYVCCYALGTPVHSWQLVAQGKLGPAHKGMLHAAKLLAATAADLMEDPEQLAAAKAELGLRLERSPYRCPIPAGIEPALPRPA